MADRSGLAEVVLTYEQSENRQYFHFIIMSYHVYILFSSKLNRFYVGFTKNVDSRISQHNKGESSYTSTGIPWSLLWSTVKSTIKDAEELEQKLKNLSQERKIRFMNKYDKGIDDQILLKKFSTMRTTNINPNEEKTV